VSALPDRRPRRGAAQGVCRVVLAIAVSRAVFAAGGDPGAGDTAAEIMKLERDLARAAVAIDVEAIRRIEAESYVYTDARGKSSTREDFIRAYQNGEGRVRSLEYDDMTVDAYGDAAVVRGRLKVERQDGDKTLTRTARYTRFYVRRDGRWQAVAGHSSEIPAEKK
jgi:ketosteroid isomerase-like protein